MGLLDEHQASVDAQRARRSSPAEGRTSREVATLTGLSYRQLTYWIGEGYITPSVRTAAGSGDQHRWSDSDVTMLRRVRQLLDAGVSLHRVRSAVPFIRDTEGCRWLYVSGGEVGVCTEGELEQSVRGEACVVVDLGGDRADSLTSS